MLSPKPLEASLLSVEFSRTPGWSSSPISKWCQYSTYCLLAVVRILYTKWLVFLTHYSSIKTQLKVELFQFLYHEMPQNTRKQNDMPNITKQLKMAKRDWPPNSTALLTFYFLFWLLSKVMFLGFQTSLRTCFWRLFSQELQPVIFAFK